MERPRAMKSQRDRDMEAEADLGGRAPFIPRAPSLSPTSLGTWSEASCPSNQKLPLDPRHPQD